MFSYSIVSFVFCELLTPNAMRDERRNDETTRKKKVEEAIGSESFHRHEFFSSDGALRSTHHRQRKIKLSRDGARDREGELTI